MKTAEEWVKDLLQEHERAIKQRDTFVLTGISTASHGGSHDTCFGHIVKQIQLDAYKAGMIEAAEICKSHTNNACETGFASQFDCQQAILSARDRKESL